MHHLPLIELHRPSGRGSGFGCLGPDNDLGARDEERRRFGETLHKAGGGNDSRGASRACGVVLYDVRVRRGERSIRRANLSSSHERQGGES